MKKTVYVCETCGRSEMEPLRPNHFKPNVHDGICGATTTVVEYVRRSLADRIVDAVENEKGNELPLKLPPGSELQEAINAYREATE